MSSTPNGPKREGGGSGGDIPRPSLDQTFFGVAPPAPARPATPSGSAIIAAPVISVSGNEKPAAKAAPARLPEKVSAQAAPARPSNGTPPRTNLGGGWQSANVAPRPVGADRTLLHPTPPAHMPGARPVPSAGAGPEPLQARPGVTPVEHRPTGAAALQHTALASDYLRAARDAAVAPRPEATPQRFTPVPAAGLTRSPRDSAIAREPQPAPIPPFSPPVQAARPQPAPPAFERAAAPARQVARDVSPLFSPTPGFDTADAAPRSMGTQASVAPPRQDAAPSPRQVLNGPRQPAEVSMPERQPPRSLAGTLLEQPLSAPLPANQAQAERPVLAAGPNAAPVGGFATRFEPVPSVRAPLGEQSPGSFGLPAAGDHGASDWSQQTAAPGAGANAKTQKSGRSQLRLFALASLALGAIAFATFGDELVGRGVSQGLVASAAGPASDVDTATAMAQTTLANRPREAAAREAPTVASTATATALASPTADGPAATAATDVERMSDEPRNDLREASAHEGADIEPSDSSASPEAKLGAAAGRHVIAGRYAEALPIYQQLQQTAPENTAYAAMVRVLGRRLSTAQGSGASPEAPAAPGGKR